MKLIKLLPVYKDYIWGGSKLKEGYGKITSLPCVAESWELSCHPDGESIIKSGEYDGLTLASFIKDNLELLGSNCLNSDGFPILVKLIDSRDDLSIQVHPDDSFAREHEGQAGKTEMWYVIEHDEDAYIYFGVNREVSREELAASLEDGSVTDLLNKVKVKAGDVFFIEAGTIHALGKGVVLAEIQQSSNVTYRLYDYGRLGADGNPRELHIEKAMACASLRPPEVSKAVEGFLASCKYFSVIKRVIKGCGYGFAADDSFHSLMVISGSGTVECGSERIEFSKGDSLFIAANAGRYVIYGDCEVLVIYAGAAKPVFRVGADIGGTAIKIGVLDPDNAIIARTTINTEASKPWDDVVKRLALAVREKLIISDIPVSMCTGIGIACAGTVDPETCTVVYSNNLGWRNATVADELSKYLELTLKMSNDANCAALGEVVAGVAKGCQSAVLLTLGTGLGGGVVLNGKLFEGAMVGAVELGHFVLLAGGEPCTCGRRGCFEAYASATALFREAEKALITFPKSTMALADGTLDKSRIFKSAVEGDPAAAGVVYNYINALGAGITDIVNIFRPEKIIIGGGIANAEDFPIQPLIEFVSRHAFGGPKSKLPVIVKAMLGNDAGVVGAANLF